MGERTWESAGEVAARRFTPDALRSRPPRLKTGFPTLDALLGGGITPGVMVLGASPGLGKSTLALQIAANVSSGENRVPVLLYSLEMPRDRLIAKLQSRQLFQWGIQRSGLPDNLEAASSYLTADAFFQPETVDRLSDAAWAEIRRAQQEIGELCIRDNLRSAEEIRQDVRSFRESRAKDGDTRTPMVIVDYLQILSNPTGRRSVGERQVVEENLNQLSELGRGSDAVPILLISSVSRAGYGGPVRMENFKETGGIEYNADLLLGLHFTKANESSGLDLTPLKNEFPRDVELVVLKQRYGNSGGRVRFLYYAPFDCFLEPSAPISAGAIAPTPAAQTAERTAPKVMQPVSVPVAAAAVEKSAALETAAEEKKGETASPEKTPGKRRSPTGYINNTKVANEIRKGHQELVEEDWIKCEVSREGAEDKQYARYRLSGPISAFDMDVLDALSTLWHRGAKTFTDRQILVTLTGDTAITATPQKVQEVQEVLQRLRTTEITLDCTDEFVARKEAQPGEQVLVQGPMVSLEDTETGYRFADRDDRGPIPLWWYAEQLNQMLSIPEALLSAREKGERKPQDTVENILLKRFLIRRLEIYRANPHLSMNVFRCVPKNRTNQGLLWQLGIYRESLRPNPELKKTVKRVHAKLLQEIYRLHKLGYIAAYEEMDADGIKVVSLGSDPKELFELDQ